IEIGLEDLVLSVERLDLQRGDGFLELARQRRRAADVVRIEIARQLLGDGRTALPVTGEGTQRRAADAPPVEPEMLAEAMIFGGNQCVDDIRRNLVERDPFAVRALEHR